MAQWSLIGIHVGYSRRSPTTIPELTCFNQGHLLWWQKPFRDDGGPQSYQLAINIEALSTPFVLLSPNSLAQLCRCFFNVNPMVWQKLEDFFEAQIQWIFHSFVIIQPSCSAHSYYRLALEKKREPIWQFAIHTNAKGNGPLSLNLPMNAFVPQNYWKMTLRSFSDNGPRLQYNSADIEQYYELKPIEFPQ